MTINEFRDLAKENNIPDKWIDRAVEEIELDESGNVKDAVGVEHSIYIAASYAVKCRNILERIKKHNQERESIITSFKKTIYFHMEKGEQIWELENQAKSKGFNSERLRYLGYEVEMVVEIFEDGTNKVISIQGVDVSDKEIKI